MQQLQNQNIKLKETMQANLVKMQEKSQKQEETIQELVLENRKLKDMLESMNSENQFTTAMLDAPMDKLLAPKLQALKKVQQSHVVKPTKTQEIEAKPQHANINTTTTTTQKQVEQPRKTEKVVKKEIIQKQIKNEIDPMLVKRKKGTTQLLGLFNTEDDVY